jgi:hypothetical protein
VQGSDFDEAEFFRAIAASGARALLIGRRALVALGIPVLTADYDFWLHIDDIAAFNAAVEPMGLFPTRTPDEARERGRYVLENSPEAIARVRALSERVLDAEEFRAALATPLGEEEEEETRALIRWFRRRHPTPADRLAYARRAYRRWAKARP